jgi:hypothetical protein
VKLGEIDILSNTQSFITWYNFSFINYKYMIKFVSDLQLVVFSEYSVFLHQTKLTATKILLKMALYTITTTFPKRADKASLLTASGILLHAFPSMSVSSLREFPENCVYRQGGFNCFIKYLHRKLLTTNFSPMIVKVLNKTCIYWICILK